MVRPTRFAASVLLPLLALPALGSSPQAAPQERSAPADGETRDAAADVARAARVLARRGYADEATRLREIAEELRGRRTGARRLLAADVDERGVRVRMLELIAEGYARHGFESNAEALRFLAEAGRAAEEGREPRRTELPAALRAPHEGTVMDELRRIVEGAPEILRVHGDEAEARVAERLARFYRERAERARRESDLTYIEGRAPVLELAREAYQRHGSENDAKRRAWVDWMAAQARNRADDEQRPLPPLPDQPVSWPVLLDAIEGAAALWDSVEQPQNAERCRALARYYEQRERGEVEDNSREQVAPMDREEPSGEEGEQRLRQRVEELRAEAERLKAELARIRAELARRDR